MARLRQWRTGWIAEWGQALNRASPIPSSDPRMIQDLTPFLFLFCDVEALPKSGNLHRPNIQLAVYEVATPEQALQLAARGVDFVETFAIGEMQKALSKI